MTGNLCFAFGRMFLFRLNGWNVLCWRDGCPLSELRYLGPASFLEHRPFHDDFHLLEFSSFSFGKISIRTRLIRLTRTGGTNSSALVGRRTKGVIETIDQDFVTEKTLLSVDAFGRHGGIRTSELLPDSLPCSFVPTRRTFDRGGRRRTFILTE